MNKKQLVMSLLLLGFGTYLLYSSININLINEDAGGILLGQGAILILWGLRELIGSTRKGEKENADAKN